jgi:putative membrane protein
LEEMTAMMFGYGGMGDGWPVWAVVLMGIGMLAFLGVLIWAGYVLMTNATRRSHQQRRDGQGAHERPSGADAREVLDERLARGEIDATEYQRLRGLIAAS